MPKSPEETDDDDDKYLNNDHCSDNDDHDVDQDGDDDEEVDISNDNVFYLEQLLFCRIQDITQHWFVSHLFDDDEYEDEDYGYGDVDDVDDDLVSAFI